MVQPGSVVDGQEQEPHEELSRFRAEARALFERQGPEAPQAPRHRPANANLRILGLPRCARGARWVGESYVTEGGPVKVCAEAASSPVRIVRADGLRAGPMTSFLYRRPIDRERIVP